MDYERRYNSQVERRKRAKLCHRLRSGWVVPSIIEPRVLYRFGVFEVDPRAGELRKQGKRLKIQEQPLKLLCILLAEPGEVVSREQLRQALWPDTFVDFDQALNSAVRRLRRVLGDDAESPRFVETLGSRGYRLIYPVQIVVPSPAGESAGGNKAEVATGMPANAARPSRSAEQRRAAGYAAAIVAALAIASLAFWRNSRPPKPALAAIQSLAVLPLENLSGDPSQQYFADGLTDQLITNLGQISDLRVISRTSVMRYKGAQEPLPQIGRELNVDVILEGAILKSGDRVRINAQLVAAPSDKQLWGKTYQGDLRDVLALQARVAVDIADQIRSNLSPQKRSELGRARVVNPDAYDDYLKGLYFANLHDPGGLEEAISCFRQAVQKDPGYALAYAGLAEGYHELSNRDVTSPLSVAAEAKTAAVKAIQLDDSLAAAHATLASIESEYFESDLSTTERELQHAIQLDPNYAPAYDTYAALLSEESRPDEAIREAEKALQLDPLSMTINAHLADAFFFGRRFQEAIAQHRKTAEMFPAASEPNQDLTLDYLVAGMHAEFLLQARRWLELSGEASSREDAAELGRLKPADYRQGVQILIRQAIAQRKAAWASPTWIACLYAEDDDREQALLWLQKAYDERDDNLRFIKTEPSFDSVRSAPRFRKILALAGLTR